MPCHIMKNGMVGTFCGKKIGTPSWGSFDTFVEELSRRVMEMPDCKDCRRKYLQEKLRDLNDDDP